MPSTYTLNNGIELIATGEQSGTWGDTTNTNFNLIDTALDGQVTITLASAGTSGSPNTLAISDGSASNGRNRLVIYTDGGDLGATAYVQLTPNDAEKIVYIRNNLSGSRSIIVFQGTYNASNDYEIPAGTTAVIFFNGGGAGAVAANVFNNAYFDSLRLGGVSVTAILDEDNMASDSATALATQQSIKAYVDAQVGANNELSEVLANGNTTGGTDIVVSSGDQITTNTINETTAASGVTIDGVLLKDNGITATGGGSLTGTWSDLGTVTTVDINGGTIDGTVIGGSTPAAISGTTGQFGTSLNVDGTITSDGLTVDGTASIDGASGIPLTLDVDAGANTNLQFNEGSALRWYLRSVTVSNDFNFYGNGASRLNISSGGDISFYEDTGTTPKFFWDASAEALGIGTASPLYPLSVRDPSFGTVAEFRTIDGTNNPGLEIKTSASGTTLSQVYSSGASANLILETNAAERMRITSTGNVGIGTSSPVANTPLTLEGPSGYTDTLWLKSVGTNIDSRINIAPTGTGNAQINNSTGTAIEFQTSGTERMRIDSSGNVGIGVVPESWYTAFSTKALQLGGTTSLWALTNGSTDLRTSLDNNLYISSSGLNTYLNAGPASRYQQVNGQHIWSNAASGTADTTATVTEAMRIDASGNLLVGKTSNSNSTAGTTLYGNGKIEGVRDGGSVHQMNRLTSDGSILDFQKDGTTVGSIGSRLGANIVITAPTATYFDSSIRPLSDNSKAIGTSTLRFTDLYLSGGVYLGGTGAANKLDDYEEGTWTPTQGNFIIWSSPTFSATYVKIGKLVHVRLYQTGGTVGWSAGAYMTGLPFNPVAGAVGYATDSGPTSNNGPILFWVGNSIYFQTSGSETNLVFSGTYETA